VAGRRDIVLARFPFTDQAGTKLRPVLILAEIPGPYHDYVVLFITSQLGQATPGLDVVIHPTDACFVQSGLKVASVFRIGKLASMSEMLISGTLGTLEQPVFDEIVIRLTRLFQAGQSS